MKKCADLLPLFAALLFLSSSALVLAGGGKKAKTPEYHDTVIESVSPASLVVSMDREKRTYPINQFTEIALKGQKTTLAELRPGMMVTVVLGVDGVTASRINAGDPPVHNEPERKKVKVSKSFMK